MAEAERRMDASLACPTKEYLGATFTGTSQKPYSSLPSRNRISALRACAVSDSPLANTDATRPNSCTPCSLHMINELRFWKS